MLDEILEKLDIKINVVFDIYAPDDVIIQRLSGRRMCKGCGRIYHLRNMPPENPEKCDDCGDELYLRSDDQPGVVKERLNVYMETTAPLIEYYKSKGIVKKVDFSGNVVENLKQLELILKTLK